MNRPVAIAILSAVIAATPVFLQAQAGQAVGAAAADMVEAILKDKKKIVPCSVCLQGEYGVRDLFVGVPVKLGKGGAEQVIEITLTPDEQAAFQKSAAAVKELTSVIGV